MLPLPHGRILLIIGWGLLALIVIGSLVPHVPSSAGKVNDKLQHFAGYFVLMLWFSGLYPRHQHWLLVLGFVALGGALELLQGFATQVRAMDMRDLVANTAGIATAFLLGSFGLANWARRVEAWLTRR